MRLIIAGGGTGGHLYPGLALAREFQRMGKTEILFVGTKKGVESEILQKEGFQLAKIRVSGIMNRGILKGLVSILILPLGLIDSLIILLRFRPNVIIGIGGYASGPIVFMAMLLRIKRVILEPNLMPGITNRILAPLADMIAVAFEETKGYLKGSRIALTGNPIRNEFFNMDKANPPASEAGSGSNITTLLIFGGSQGAHSINKAMIDALDYMEDMKDRLFIIHQTGRSDYPLVDEIYRRKGFKTRVEPYIFDIAKAYHIANLIIARAGATTIAEITACGRPAILIPFPYSTHGHQWWNAMAMKEAGAAEVIDDDQLNGRILVETIRKLLSDSKALNLMGERSRSRGKRDAAKEIVLLCNRLAGGEI